MSEGGVCARSGGTMPLRALVRGTHCPHTHMAHMHTHAHMHTRTHAHTCIRTNIRTRTHGKASRPPGRRHAPMQAPPAPPITHFQEQMRQGTTPAPGLARVHHAPVLPVQEARGGHSNAQQRTAVEEHDARGQGELVPVLLKVSGMQGHGVHGRCCGGGVRDKSTCGRHARTLHG
jgi:hypothetical protein